MNATIFWRIFWKEYRTQRAFWISMVMLTIVVDLLFRMTFWDSHADAEQVHGMFGAALAFAAFYALGSGAILFATERESGTYDFLRALPVTPLVVFAGKIVFALVSTAILFPVVWTLTLALAGALPEPNFHHDIWAASGLGAIELMTWGIFFSLSLKRPLVAVIAAVTVDSTLLFILGGGSNQVLGVDLYLRAVPARLLIVALLTVANISLARRWFRERLLPGCGAGVSPAWLRQAGRLHHKDSDATAKTVALAPPAISMLGTLVWQEWRQSSTLTWALLALLLPNIVFSCVEPLLGTLAAERGLLALLPGLALAGFFAAPLLGSTLFLTDQTNCRFRFLAERGIPPRLVWLSRQIRGVVLMLIGMLVFLPLLLRDFARTNAPVGVVLIVEQFVGFVVIAYASGQLCSMTLRSGILAAVSGTMLTIALCGWAAMMYWLGLSWLWTVAPLPLAFLIATWLRAPDWLIERNTWRARLRSDLVIAVPLLAILVAIPLVRVYEIPLVDLGFDPQEVTKSTPAEEQETLTLYQRAIELQRQAMPKEGSGGSGRPGAVSTSTVEEAARRKAEEQAVTLALEASRRPFSGFHSGRQFWPDWDNEMRLADLVLASAKRLGSEGKLDAALDRYVAAIRIEVHAQQRFPWVGRDLEVRVNEQLTRWAAHSGQKPQRVLDAIRTMEQQWRNGPSYSDAIRRDYLWNLDYLKGNPENRGDQYFAFARWLPWERTVALRLLNKLTAEEFARFKEAEEVLAAGGAVAEPSKVKVAPAFDRDVTYRLVYWMVVHYADQVWDRLNINDGHSGHLLMVETSRRAARLVLALEAWKLEHGRLPESLEDLKRKYLDQVPVDPYTGRAFRYEPKGLPHYLACRTRYTATKTIAPGQPFIACATWSINSPTPGFNGEPIPVESPEDSAGNAAPKTEVWEGVWVFPIP